MEQQTRRTPIYYKRDVSVSAFPYYSVRERLLETHPVSNAFSIAGLRLRLDGHEAHNLYYDVLRSRNLLPTDKVSLVTINELQEEIYYRSLPDALRGGHSSVSHTGSRRSGERRAAR